MIAQPGFPNCSRLPGLLPAPPDCALLPGLLPAPPEARRPGAAERLDNEDTEE